ncbi:hypothetical protein AB0J52_20275 [Spirillospora sp. NPDC049652]
MSIAMGVAALAVGIVVIVFSRRMAEANSRSSDRLFGHQAMPGGTTGSRAVVIICGCLFILFGLAKIGGIL